MKYSMLICYTDKKHHKRLQHTTGEWKHATIYADERQHVTILHWWKTAYYYAMQMKDSILLILCHTDKKKHVTNTILYWWKIAYHYYTDKRRHVITLQWWKAACYYTMLRKQNVTTPQKKDSMLLYRWKSTLLYPTDERQHVATT